MYLLLKHNAAATAVFNDKPPNKSPKWFKKRFISFTVDKCIDNEFSHGAFASSRDTFESEGNFMNYVIS
jgi:hypothetical protein